MSDPIAQRVLSRFIRAAAPHDLQKRVEVGAHRGQEMLHALGQQHGFWMRAIAEGKPGPEINKHYEKIGTWLKLYQREVASAMGALRDIHDMSREPEVQDFPESYERYARTGSGP